MGRFDPPFMTLEEQVFRRVCLAVRWDGDCKNILALRWMIAPTESGVVLPDMSIQIIKGTLTIQSPCSIVSFTLHKSDWLVRWGVCADDDVGTIRKSTLERVTDTDLNLFAASDLSSAQVRTIYNLK